MTSRHTSLGGIAGPNLAVLLCFLAGIVELLMALLKLGALVDLISLPVTIGFTSATALIIGASQLKGLLGLQGGGGSSNFLPTIKFVITRFNELRPSDALLGIGSIIILLAMRVNKKNICIFYDRSKIYFSQQKLKDIKTPENASKSRRIFGGFLWLISTARNAIIVLVSSVIAYYAHQSGYEPFILTGKVKSGKKKNVKILIKIPLNILI
jgi:sodium-independent sulfate anion transporter 11